MFLKLILTLQFLLFFLLACSNSHKQVEVKEDKQSFFSLKEISSYEHVEPSPIQYFEASDKVRLAYRSYLSDNAKAVVVLYHGGAAHSGLSYQYLGASLAKNHNLHVFTPDIRGHGHSAGPRGDTPESELVWDDVNSMIELIKSNYPDLPIYLAGHSSGAGLVLNHSSWNKALPVKGHLFIAPYFGYKSNTKIEDSDFNFTEVKTSRFVFNSMSGGLLFGNSPAVLFNYPKELLQKEPLITPYNTVNMANALTPQSPGSQISKLKNFGLWIGAEDEAFDAVKVVKFVEENQSESSESKLEIIPNTNHLSILVGVSDFIGEWLD